MSSPAFGWWGFGTGGYGGGGGTAPLQQPVVTGGGPPTGPRIIIYRQLNANGEPQYGQGAANFLVNQQAVAQAVLTRLRLWLGEWWETLTEGTPVWQQILGIAPIQLQQISLVLQERILLSPYVLSMTSSQITFDPVARQLNYVATVQTEFGPVILSNLPAPDIQSLP